MSEVPVFAQSELFKRGCVAGFYEAISDDGAKYLHDIWHFGLRSIDDRDFLAGYRLGRQMRLGMSASHFVQTLLADAA